MAAFTFYCYYTCLIHIQTAVDRSGGLAGIIELTNRNVENNVKTDTNFKWFTMSTFILYHIIYPTNDYGVDKYNLRYCKNKDQTGDR